MAKFNQFLVLAIMALLPIIQAERSHSHHPDFYGKPCTNDSYNEPELAHCDLDKNMYYSERGICECIIGERGRVFAHFERTCIEVASVENDFNCDKDVQCKLSSYGRYSRCNMEYDKCECHDGNEKTALVENVCYIQSPPQPLKARGYQDCSSNDVCLSSSLAKLSRCNMETTQCECYDTLSNGKQEATEYNGRCVYKRMLKQFCNEDDECRAGYHKNAVCGSHPSFLPVEKVCFCPEGLNCDGDGSGAHSSVESQSLIMIGFTTVIMGLLATKVLGRTATPGH